MFAFHHGLEFSQRLVRFLQASLAREPARALRQIAAKPLSPFGVMEPPISGILEPAATRLKGTIDGLKLEWFCPHWQDAGGSPPAVGAGPGSSSRRAPGSKRVAHAIERCAGQQLGGREGLVPFDKVQVAGHDGGGTLVALGHEFMQIFVGGRAKGFESEVVDKGSDAHALVLLDLAGVAPRLGRARRIARRHAACAACQDTQKDRARHFRH